MTSPSRLTFHDFAAVIDAAIMMALDAQETSIAAGAVPDWDRLYLDAVWQLRESLDVANDGLRVRVASRVDELRRRWR